MYYGGGYCDIVGMMAEDSMNNAVTEVKVLPDYAANGEVIITCV